MSKRFWFYNDWFADENDEVRSWFSPARYGFATGSDEYGHHTVVIPLGKGRAVCIAYRAAYKGFKRCLDCVEGRQQMLDFEQDMYYAQTYWNVEELDDVHDLSMKDWNEALGVNNEG